MDDAYTRESLGAHAPAAQVAAAPSDDDFVTGFAPARSRPAHGSTPRLSSSGSLGSGRFIPGTLLAGRYRIVGQLGKGGMGEVYRAEDLLLAQQVALKFLPPGLSRDPDRLARFRDEVRTAREVSHPNVCRVYDIGEVAGEHFLSMEYIDGEDLASLLRRIGRLPQDKGIELARQLCAGLAAAHDRGVLHRDLKPANVMIDGRGHVRLADFGLAGAADPDNPGDLAGTPAYMAPEQFLGKPASVQSDIYALGLVLYELFTGKPVVSGRTVAELARQHREQQPSSMTALVAELDPAVERTIQRCLEKDPIDRPPSALSVSAALPGGDPLKAAIARGETPSPELVAAAGEIGFLKPLVAVGLVLSVLAGLIIVAVLSDSVILPRLIPMPRPPEVLRDRGRQTAAALGYRTEPIDTASGFAHSDYIQHLADKRLYTPERVRAGRPAAMVFWYRESPRPLFTTDFLADGRVSPNEPPRTVPGMIEVIFDTTGRLLGFTAVPPRSGDSATPPPDTDWVPLFKAMELDQTKFTAAPPTRTPPVFADTRAAWTGVYPESPDVAIRVEAASLRGRIVHMQVVEPWTESAESTPRTGRFNDVVVPIVFFVLAGGAVLLAIRNARLGRGDRRGAFRVAIALVVVTYLDSLLGADMSGSVTPLMLLVFSTLSRSLLFGGLFWVAYLALEPSVRRQWPHALISWSRLLVGRWRDPLVGRDALAGTALGVFATVLAVVNVRLSGTPNSVQTATLDGGRFALSVILGRVNEAVLIAIGILLGLFFFTLLVRRRWIAVGLVLMFFAFNAASLAVTNPPLQALVTTSVVAALLFGLLRLGLLTLVVSIFTTNLLGAFALTLDPSPWYAGFGYLVMAVVLGLSVLAFWRATPVRTLVGQMLSE